MFGKHGAFISFPGRRYAVDLENRIYTSFAEYDTSVYAYDLIKVAVRVYQESTFTR
jgi:hypothetical protein